MSERAVEQRSWNQRRSHLSFVFVHYSFVSYKLPSAKFSRNVPFGWIRWLLVSLLANKDLITHREISDIFCLLQTIMPTLNL